MEIAPAPDPQQLSHHQQLQILISLHHIHGVTTHGWLPSSIPSPSSSGVSFVMRRQAAVLAGLDWRVL